LPADTVKAPWAAKGYVTVVLIFIFASALCTQVIGIHALFGAFLAGVVMPSRAGCVSF
jgi:Kef-type K+ transport system membrane component KefB